MQWKSFHKTLTKYFLITVAILSTKFYCSNSTPVPPLDTVDLLHSLNALEYSPHPNEVLPIQPVLLYPKTRKTQHQGRNLDHDDDIIYVKLLKRKSYRPQKHPTDENELVPMRELTMKDIFYVKALANGQFSDQRLKWYRLPEFYAINVYRNGPKF